MHAAIASPDHLVRSEQDGLRDLQSKSVGGLEVDHQLELRRLFHWEVGGFSTLEDFVHVGRCPLIICSEAGAVGHEATRLYELAVLIHGGKPLLDGKVHDALPVSLREGLYRRQ